MGSEMMGKTSGEKQGVSLTTHHAKPIFLRLFARLSSLGHSCLAPARADRVGQALGRLLFLSPAACPPRISYQLKVPLMCQTKLRWARC